MSRQFVVVTKDFSGLGWAKKLKEEGETVTLAGENPEEKPDDKKMWDQVATDWIPRMSLSEAMSKLRTDSTYWIFAENNYPDEADTLRLYGQKVFGTSELSDKMEHERGYACDIAEQYGLLVPETYQCSTREEGLKYLDDNPDKAYVFKPDDSGGANFTTFVPIRKEDVDANRETYTYLEQMKDEPGSYVLQERVFGVEVDLELWLYEGKPVMAYATLEAKRKNAHGLGEMAGCAGDFCWVVPVDAPLVDYTIGKMLPFYQDEQYTGLADVNVVLTAKGPVFLEACFDDQTEILTREGWKLIKDVPCGTEVATLNRHTHELEYQQTTDLIVQDYDGEMVHIGGGSTNVDCLTTPNHLMYVNKPRHTSKNTLDYTWCDVRADELRAGSVLKRDAMWTSSEVPTFTIPEYVEKHYLGKYKRYMDIVHPAKTVPMDTWVKFLAWYLSEGSQDGCNVNLAQFKYCDRLEATLKDMPFEYRVEKAGFRICSTQLATLLAPFGLCYEKYVPDYVKNLSARQIRLFLDEYAAGDGSSRPHRSGNGGHEQSYFTTSARMADDLQELVLKSGSYANIKQTPTKGTVMEVRGRSYVRNHDIFVVSERAEHTGLWLLKKHLKREPYRGKVYCVSVPNRTIYARRNGKALWTANCNRFGYNSHVTLFLGLALDNFGDIMADFMDGKIDHFPDRFSPEIGASITVFLDHPRPGMPLHIDERWKEQYYPFDGYLKDDTMLLSGYSSELGIFVEYGTSIHDASDRCLDKLLRREAVSVPDMHYRVDLGESDYPGGIVARYTALNDQWGHSMRIVGGAHGARR